MTELVNFNLNSSKHGPNSNNYSYNNQNTKYNLHTYNDSVNNQEYNYNNNTQDYNISTSNDYSYHGQATSMVGEMSQDVGIFDSTIVQKPQNNNPSTNVFKRTGATVATGFLSLIEGLGLVGEGILDTGATIIGGATALGAGVYDMFNGTNYSDAIWDATKDFVKTNHVNDMFDSYLYGKPIKNNSFKFDQVRSVGNMVGETVGIIAGGGTLKAVNGLSTAVSLGSVAGVSGFGKGAANAWNTGASTGRGIAAGLTNGAIEFAKWAGGAKIAEFAPLTNSAGLSSLKKVIGNAAIRTGLYGLDGAASAVIDPLSSVVANKKSYFDALEERGGLKSIAKSAGFAALMGGGFELIGVFKYVKANKADIFLSKHNKNSNDYGVNQGALKESKLIEAYTNKRNIIQDPDAFKRWLNYYDNKGLKDYGDDVIRLINEGHMIDDIGVYKAMQAYYIETGANGAYESISESYLAFERDFSYTVNPKYQSLVDKYTTIFGNQETAISALYEVDSHGVCDYSTKANDIMIAYKGNEIQFKKDFGFDMYKADGSFNEEELLADMFFKINTKKPWDINADKMFSVDPELKVLYSRNGYSNTSYNNKVALAGLYNDNAAAFDSYLKFKNINLSYESSSTAYNNANYDLTQINEHYLLVNSNPATVINDVSASDLTKTISHGLNKGENLQLNVYPGQGRLSQIPFYDNTGNLYSYIDGGHGVKITGVQGDKIVVSSWGKRGYINASDLTQKGGLFTIVKCVFGGIG